MSEKISLKFNILKKIIGKKMVVIKDYIKNQYYYGTVQSIIDEANVKIKSPSGEIENISIFDLRSHSCEYE
jgi:bifunctional ADP-heptose synthase (sugar kinase/adenylyltransferase)